MENLIPEILKVSPFAAVLLAMIWALWKKLNELIASHDTDRKENQEKILQVFKENSASHVQLANSVDNLNKSVLDNSRVVDTRLAAVEQKLEKNGRTIPRPIPKVA